VAAEDTHYEVLGVAENASTAEVEAAVAQLAHVASALALTAPAQADALWLRIRQISRDLLSGDERRRAYDQSLPGHVARPRTSAPEKAALAAPVVMGTAIRPRQARVAPLSARSGRRSLRKGAADLGVALALMAAVSLLFVQPWNWGHSTVTPSAPLALSAAGPQQGDAYRSGEAVQLHWTSAGRNAIYRVQIGRGTSLKDRFVAFLPAWRRVLTDQTSYTFHALGPQFYFWRVQAMVGGTWQPWSQTSVLAVAAPQVSIPNPRGGSVRNIRPGRTRLCWTPVAGAAGYSVSVDARSPLSTTATCVSVNLGNGVHHWRVAATARGVRLYIGAYSTAVTLRAIAARRHVTAAKPRASTHSQPAAHQSGSSGSQAGTTVVIAPPNAVAVAAAQEPASGAHTTSHQRSSAGNAGPTPHQGPARQPVSISTPRRAPAVHRIPPGKSPQPFPAQPSPPAPPGQGTPRTAPPAPHNPPPTVYAAPTPQPTPPPGHAFVAAITPPVPPKASPTQSAHVWVVPPTPGTSPAP
jgi:hypothetical protein